MVCDFSTVAFSCCGLSVHWYSLAYIVGIIAALYIVKRISSHYRLGFSDKVFDDFTSYAIFGIIIGGRMGHVLFYDAAYYLKYPIEILQIWKGGMSFYGGFLGVICATYIFCYQRKLSFMKFIDIWSVTVPIGLFLGRIANFINGELVGRPTTLPWCVIFRDGIPRHPSQLYESFAEGILLGICMFIALFRGAYKWQGRLSGIFCCGYGVARICCEFFREPDSDLSAHLLITTGINLNQYMSLVLMFLGIFLIYRSSQNAS